MLPSTDGVVASSLLVLLFQESQKTDATSVTSWARGVGVPPSLLCPESSSKEQSPSDSSEPRPPTGELKRRVGESGAPVMGEESRDMGEGGGKGWSSSVAMTTK